MLLVQSRFHANHLTENENVIAGSAQDCYVIVRYWLTMFANNDTADTFSNEISIPAHTTSNLRNSLSSIISLSLSVKVQN